MESIYALSEPEPIYVFLRSPIWKCFPLLPLLYVFSPPRALAPPFAVAAHWFIQAPRIKRLKTQRSMPILKPWYSSKDKLDLASLIIFWLNLDDTSDIQVIATDI